jgi:hypothetical protein
MENEYIIGDGFTAQSLGPVFPVEIWKKQCCGKPKVKLLTVAYFREKSEADSFVQERNTLKVGAA